MALGKELGDFSFKWTSLVFGQDGTAQLAVDGTATGFGTVLGTIHASGAAGGKEGPCQFIGRGYLDSGEIVDGTAEGTWEECGKHQWRLRGVNKTSDGQTFASDGILDLASRSYKGKLLEWS